MELFQLIGKIVIDGVDDASKNLDGVAKKANEVGTNMTKAGENISKAGQKLLPVSVAIGGIGTAIVKTSADFEAGMSEVQAISGATGDDLKALEEKAKEMGSKTKFSASEASEGLKYMAMAGWKTTEMLDGLEGIMNLASASGEDLGTTSDIVTDALTAFGLSAKDSTHFADVLATASSNANTNVSMMGETFKYVAPVAGALGYSAEDCAQAIGLMANAGIKGTQAGTALRSMFSRLSAPPKECAEAMEALGLSITKENGEMKTLDEVMQDLRSAFDGLGEAESAEMAKKIAGQEAMSGLLAIVNASEQDYNKLSSAIGNCDGSAQRMAETMNDNLTGQITILKSQIEGVCIQLGEILVPIIKDVVAKVSEWVTWFSNLDESHQRMIVVIAGVVASLAPLLIVGGKLISGIGTVTKLVSLVIPLVGGSIAPILAIVAVIGLVVTAIVKLWNENALFRRNVLTMFHTLQSAFNDLWTVFQTIWETIGRPIWEAIQFAIDLVANAIFENMPAITAFFNEAMAGMKDSWENHLKPALEAIGAFLDTVLKPIFEAVFKSFILPTVKMVFETIGKLWNSVLKPVFNGICDFLTGVFTLNWRLALNGIVSIFKGIVNSIIGSAEFMVNGFIMTINEMLAGVSAVASAVGSLLGLDPVSLSLEYASFPRLAKGGVLEKGQIGFLEGDGAEAVVPLEQNRKWIAKVADDMESQGIGGGKETLDVLKGILSALQDLKDENAKLPDTLVDAMAGNLTFAMNNREFARMVKAVN